MGKVSRVNQIVEWLGANFDGVIIFDESHAMQNAAGGKRERGDQAASQQGRAGLRLQHALPNARRFIRTTLGLIPVSRWSSICAASKRVTAMPGKRSERS